MLNDEVYNQIVSLCEQGDELVENEDLSASIKKYLDALDLLPNPKHIWEASTWIYTALGDTYYLTSQYEEALNFLFESLKCPDGGLENPFILLRIGECFFELENIEKAQEYLLQAYMFAGPEIYEDEDIKYYQVIEPLI